MLRKRLSIISTVCYFVFLGGGSATALYMRYLIDKSASSEGTEGFAALGYAIIMILATAYAIASLIPFILKLVDIFANKKALAGTALFFDVIISVFNAALLVSSIADTANGGDSVGSIILMAALLSVSLTSFITNVISLRISGY